MVCLQQTSFPRSLRTLDYHFVHQNLILSWTNYNHAIRNKERNRTITTQSTKTKPTWSQPHATYHGHMSTKTSKLLAWPSLSRRRFGWRPRLTSWGGFCFLLFFFLFSRRGRRLRSIEAGFLGIWRRFCHLFLSPFCRARTPQGLLIVSRADGGQHRPSWGWLPALQSHNNSARGSPRCVGNS